MLRAAITTDARTMEDMVARESLFPIANGEVVEFFRWGNGEAVSLLRVPADGAPAPSVRGGSARLDRSETAIRVSASARLDPLYPTARVDGALVIAREIAPDALARELPPGVISASIGGLESGDVQISGTRTTSSGETFAVPVRLDDGLPELSLKAAFPAPGMNWLGGAGRFGLVLGLACAALYVVGRRRYAWSYKRS
jgi:hypothetical protein